MSLGSNIKSLLDRSGMTVKELAEKINVPPTTIYSLIQRDSKKADVDLLIAIAKALSTTTDVLLDDSRESGISYIVTTPDNHEFIIEMERVSHGVDPALLRTYAEAFKKIMEAKED